MEAAVASCFAPGDRLLSCPVGVFGKRFAQIARAQGCDVEVLDTPLGAALDPAALRARLQRDDAKNFRGILLTHNETSTGVQNDMAAIAEVTREHAALTLVDSVSGLGASPFAMDAWGYDIVVTASQKAFAAPPGVAVVAASDRAWSAIENNTRATRFYFDLRRRASSRAKDRRRGRRRSRSSTHSQLPSSAITSTDSKRNFERHASYARAVRAAFEALGCTIFSRPDAHSVTVVAAYPPEGVDAANLLKTLRERYGVVLSGGQGELTGKIVRFGTMGDIAENDLLGAVAALELALVDCGASVTPGSGVAAAGSANKILV